MESVLIILMYVFVVISIVWLVADLTRQRMTSRKRQRLEAEIRSLADDLTTDPAGMSLREAVDLLGVEMIEEIVVELRRMPAGSRSLQRAIEITGDENYGRAA
jgi:Flp pilus assembly protein TadB